MNRKFLTVWTACLCLCTAGIAQADITVDFDPSGVVWNIADGTFTMDIVADIPEQESVLGWGLDLTIDTPGIIGLMGTEILSPWDETAGTPDGDGLAGLVFPPGVWGTDVPLARFTFNPMALGSTGLTLSITDGDLTEGFALDPTGFGNAVLNPGFVTIIPEPTTLALLAMGGLALIRRR